MIFQPGSGGSGGGLTAETGTFATNSSNKTVSLGFEAKACIVIFYESADNIGFLVAGGRTNISAESGNRTNDVSLSSDGMTLSARSYGNNSIQYLALG